MNQYLCIAATFLAERYHGRGWPPAPARLFQALVAGAQTGIYRQHWTEVESALRMLECLPAPEILARNSYETPSYRLAVPNNDSDKAGREWTAGREFDSGVLRTMKTITPRAFLTSTQNGAHVYYLWRISDSDLRTEAVRQLTSFLHTFGWGIDMAYADSFLLNDTEKQSLVSKSGYSHHEPADRGGLHNIPAPGYLDDLMAAHQRLSNRQTRDGINPSIRAFGYAHQRYIISGALGTPTAQFLLRELKEPSAFYKVPWALGMKVAAWMRRAAAEALRQENYREDFINSYVLGHGNGYARHMSFAPAPTIGMSHSDGAIRRAMLVEPSDSGDAVCPLLQLKLSTSTLHELTESGPSREVCTMTEADQNDSVFRLYLAESKSLWNTVTPVILHGYNTEHGKFSLKKTEQLLYQAFEKSGYPQKSISALYFQPAPFWPGTEGALQMRVPQHLGKWPRYHVSVRFHEPVTGPLLVGIGRHYGIGLFAAPYQQGNV